MLFQDLGNHSELRCRPKTGTSQEMSVVARYALLPPPVPSAYESSTATRHDHRHIEFVA